MDESEVTLQDLKDIFALVDANDYEEALKRHLWFYEASRNSPGMGGVRLSYALESWVELGTKYPPAKDALLSVRDLNKKHLLNGEGTFDNFHDLFSINYYIEDSDDTYAVFIKLQKLFPKLARRCYQVAEKILVDKEDFKVCEPYVKNPVKIYEYIEKIDLMNEKLSNDTPDHAKEDFEFFKEETYVEHVCRLITILINLDRRQDALIVKDKALAYGENARIEAML